MHSLIICHALMWQTLNFTVFVSAAEDSVSQRDFKSMETVLFIRGYQIIIFFHLYISVLSKTLLKL